MQVKSNPIPEKQTGLERQVRSKEMTSSNNSSINTPKFERQGSEKGATQNDTSQYLKVLSRVENLLIQKKLPDAAIEGFAGAVKNQIDAMTDSERQMLMKLPELKMLELDDLDDIPEMIKNDIRNEEKNTVLLKLLRVPEFADLMRTDNKPTAKTYNSKSAPQPSKAKQGGEILSESAPDAEKPVQSSSTNVTQKINQKADRPVTNQAV